MTLSFERNPGTQKYEILSRKTRVFGAAHSKDFVILACFILTQCRSVTESSVTDERTDGRTDGRTPRRWLRRAKQSAVARKKVMLSEDLDCLLASVVVIVTRDSRMLYTF